MKRAKQMEFKVQKIYFLINDISDFDIYQI